MHSHRVEEIGSALAALERLKDRRNMKSQENILTYFQPCKIMYNPVCIATSSSSSTTL